jgi:hypothetical protein
MQERERKNKEKINLGVEENFPDRHFLQPMKERKGGAIISTLGWIGSKFLHRHFL